MLNNYAEASGGFNSNHGQTSRPAETQKQQNISSTWGYNSQLEGMYYGSEHQPMFMGPYDGSTKHSNYSQYPSGTIHQPVPTPVVKCHEACCQHFQDRYPLNPAPLRYQPSGPVQPRYTDLSNNDSRQYFTDRRSMQPSLSRKKMYPAENGFPGIPDRHFSQYMGRGQLHMADSRQQMQMIRSQYPMYPPYWGSARGWPGPRMNCPPPSYHQSVNQGAQLQTGLKMTDGTHYMDPPSQKPLTAQHRRGVGAGSGGTEIIRPVPEPKRTSLDPNLQSCYEFGYPSGFVPFSEVNKIQGPSQGNNSTCKIPNDKQFHPHQMQYPMQSTDRNMMNCTNPINDLGYPMNFPMPTNDSYLRPGLDDGQQISEARKLSLQYDSALGKKRPELDLRQYLATWEDDEEESTRLSEPVALGNNGAPYIVVDCRSLEGETSAKLQERFKPSSSQGCSSKSRSSSPTTERKRTEEQSRPDESSERTSLHPEFQTQTSCAPSMPTLISESEKNINFWSGNNRENDGIIGKGGAFQPLDCSKRDGNIDPNTLPKRDTHPHNDLSVHKVPGTNESSNMSFDALVSYYGDNRRMSDGGYDFVEMTERLVNNSDKTSSNNRPPEHQLPGEVSRPCDPRLQQSQFGNNPSIYNKVAPRYPSNNYQHFKPTLPGEPYYNYKHPLASNKYFGYDSSQIVDPNYDYHKLASDFDSARLCSNKEISKDPRRMLHQELEKTVESAFLDPIRKGQITDCFQDKTNLEFNAVDPEPFMPPIIIKKSDLDNRDKSYAEKNNTIRERMDVINSENQAHPEKTVLITSQNGPPEIFRVPYSPDKILPNKDNVVTLHSEDQNKSNTITVEVPYDQQYSTLVKLSEEISRTENRDGKGRTEPSDSHSTNKTSNEEFKKPTSFKLKRLPNSKEWTVEGREFDEANKKADSEGNSVIAEITSCQIVEERDSLKPSVTICNLNMPSLDDIRDGDENCEPVNEHSKNKLCDEALSQNKTSSMSDEINKNKCNLQPPQMAIVQPMKLNQPESESLELNLNNSLSKENDIDKKSLDCETSQIADKNSFESEKDVTERSNSPMEIISEGDISKHENFRTHKKIQGGFSNALASCLSSPNEDFLNTQDLNPNGSKETYSPFHVYSDCEINSQITDYFKIDERSGTGEKMLDNRIPSSPGVEGMFEDINHSSQNQLYQSKSCNFQDLTDPNISSLGSHNPHFQSFSSIFTDDGVKSTRPDGSILQMSDKRYIKHIFDDIENHQMPKPLEADMDRLDSATLSDKLQNSDEAKTSPPIPTISLKLNETKKIWCIANKDQYTENNDSPNSTVACDIMSKSTSPIQQTKAVNEMERDFAQDICEVKSCVKIGQSEDDLCTVKLFPESTNDTCSKSHESDLEQLIFNGNSTDNTSPDAPNILFSSIDVDAKQLHSSGIMSSNVDEKCLQGNNMVQPENTNTCLSIVKYHPKIKVFKRVKMEAAKSLMSEVLIFDKNGTHFPNSCEEKINNIEISESKYVVGGILDYLITKSVTKCHTLEQKDLACLASSDANNLGNISVQRTHHNFDIECSNVRNVQAAVETVIKFDNSSNQIQEVEQNNFIVKTTEMFIQHEKELNQHNSVIKTIQLGNCKNKQTKSVRSIFSPRSDDAMEEDISSFDTTSNFPKITFQEDIPSDFEIIKSPTNINQISCSIVHDSESINEILSPTNKESDDLATQKLIITSDNVDGEEFRGFASPKVNHISCSLDGDEIKEDHSEIDDALESMGLSNIKSLESTGVKNKKNYSKSMNETISLQESLESETEFEECLSQKEQRFSGKVSLLEAESGGCHFVKCNDLEEINNTNKFETIEEETTNDYKKKSESFNQISTDSNFIPSDIIPEGNPCVVNEKETHQVPMSNSEKNNEFPTAFPPKDVCSNEEKDSCINEDYIEKIICNSSPHNLTSAKSSEENWVKSCLDPETTNDNEINAHSTDHEVGSLSIPSTNSVNILDTSKVKDYIEDFEARLETSVIVRNKSCSSVICNQFFDASPHFSEKSPNSLNSTINVESVNNYKFPVTEVHLSNLKPSHKTGGFLDKNNESCRVNSSENIEIQSSNKNDHELYSNKMEFDIDISTKDSIESSNEGQSTNHSSGVTLHNIMDTSESNSKKPSVITQNNNNSEVSLNISKSTEIIKDETLYYCTGESFFLNIEEELKLCFKNIKFSYFNDFKKWKWKRFHKSLIDSSFSLNDCLYNQQSNKRDYSIINFSTSQDVNCENTSTVNIETECTSMLSNSHHTENNLSPLHFQMRLEGEDSSPVGFIESIVKDKISSKTGHTGKDEASNNMLLQNECKIVSEHLPESLILGKETSSGNLTKNVSHPLKDKSQYFTSTDINMCHIRRDSLKILEPEAVLKEFFSPDPDIENSESKENECPDNFSIDKHGNSSQQLETLKTNTDTSLTSLSNCSNIKIKWSDSSSYSEVIEESNKLLGHEEQYNETELSTGNLDTDSLAQVPEEPFTTVSCSCEFNDKNCSCSTCMNKLSEMHKSVETTTSESLIKAKSTDKSSGLSPQRADVSDDSLQTSDNNNSGIETNSITIQDNTTPLSTGGFEMKDDLVYDINNKETLLPSLAPSFKNILSSNEITNNLSNVSCHDFNIHESENAMSKDISKTSIDGTTDVSESQKTTSIKHDDDIGSSILSTSKPDNLVESSSQKQTETVDQDNEIGLVSQTSDISVGFKQSHGQKVETLQMPEIYREKLSSSEDRAENDDSDSSVSSDHNNKSLSGEELKVLIDPKNVKIDSVQDTLVNNQHLNKENFPLQCLVEAALALENVDSKQILLNNPSFSGIYSQPNDTFVQSPEGNINANDSTEESVEQGCPKDTNSNAVIKQKSSKGNILTAADREVFSKFEETNYNLRASTRIVTSSSSNIIPYSKRKYGLKASKLGGVQSENKKKKSESSVTEKSRSKKRRGCFTYPRSKRRKKLSKDKQKCESSILNEIDSEENNKGVKHSVSFEHITNNICEETAFNRQADDTQMKDSTDIENALHFVKSTDLDSSTESIDDISKNDFGGPLLIASENTSTDGNIFCVHVNSDKMDEYVSNLNLGEMGVLSDNSQTIFKDTGIDTEIADVSNVTLENGTSLVIIIEDVDNNQEKTLYDKRIKGETDVILGSVEDDCSPCLAQSHSMLDDCSNILTTGFSINESCICPPDFGINGTHEDHLLAEKSNQALDNESFMSISAFEMNENIEDIYGKYSVGCNQELLSTNCYEEINENLVNDIGNWPYVEEEVAEFDTKADLLNKIPEEGRKIELKCSLPWKKIFNMSKSKKKKNKESKKVSGLELGPANVEVRLKAPSSEWKVISDYHENSSPVVKVSRLILQRDSDVSSYSEKDSEEENENKRQSCGSSTTSESFDKNSNKCEQNLVKNVSYNGNWQPVVLLTRNKELDELTLSLESKFNSQKVLSSCISEVTCETEDNNSERKTPDSVADSEASEMINEIDQFGPFSCPYSSESSTSSQNSNKSIMDLPEDCTEKYKFQQSEKTEKHIYETYSPSGCSNMLTSENIYSPSDPHFSPDPQESGEGFTFDNGEQHSRSCDSDYNVYLSNDDLPHSRDSDMCDEQGEGTQENENSLERNENCQSSEQCKVIDIHELSRSSESCSQDSSICDTCLQQNNNDSFDSVCSSLPESMKNSTSYENFQVFNENNKNIESESTACESPKEIIFEQKKKTKRKMPKNFFVRKKLRRQKFNLNKTDETLLLKEESDVELKSTTVIDTMSCSVAVGTTGDTFSVQSELNPSVHELVNNTESNSSVFCENSRLQCVYDVEDSSPIQINEFPSTEKIEVNQRLRDAGRGIKRPCEGHSKEDMKRRRKKLKCNPNKCEECDIHFQNKEELCRHNAYRHARRRELHHCLLCQRSFSSAVRHSLHVQGRSHRHLELTQRHTIHAMHRLLVGGEFPRIPPLSCAEQRALQWRPSQPGYTHIYHEFTPLQTVLQENNSETSESNLPEDRTPND